MLAGLSPFVVDAAEVRTSGEDRKSGDWGVDKGGGGRYDLFHLDCKSLKRHQSARVFAHPLIPSSTNELAASSELNAGGDCADYDFQAAPFICPLAHSLQHDEVRPAETLHDDRGPLTPVVYSGAWR